MTEGEKAKTAKEKRRKEPEKDRVHGRDRKLERYVE